MQVTVTIPDRIYQAMQQGKGRVALTREFGVTDRQARYYLQTYEEAQPLPIQTAAVIADVHIPDQAEGVVKTVLTEILTWPVDLLVCLGDVFDCEALGFWPKPPTRRRFGQEYARALPVWEAVNRRIQAIPRKILVEGNHDARIQRYLWDHAEELADLDCLSLSSLLHLTEYGWELWANKARIEAQLPILTLGGMVVLHGHEVRPPGSTVINPAKNYSEKLCVPAILGHVHRSSHWPPRMVFDRPPVYTVGCLQQLNVQYDPFNRWNWGFGKLTWTDTMTTFRNYRVTPQGDIE